MKNIIRSSEGLLNTNNNLQILGDKKFENMDQQFSGLSLFLCQRKLSDPQPKSHLIFTSLCLSLQNANSYQLSLLEEIKQQLGITSSLGKDEK